MASYFDEHDCEPLRDGQGPDHFLHFARLLVDSGAWNQSEFSSMFSDRTPPPTSKKFLNDLKDHLVREETEGECPIYVLNPVNKTTLSMSCLASISFIKSASCHG